MSRQENKDLVTRAFWFLSGNKLDLFFDILAPGYVVHYPQGDLNLRRVCRGDFNLAQVKAYETLFFALFPDASATIEEMVAEGDKVAIRVHWIATHKGEALGIPPTGVRIEMTHTLIFRIAAGKLAENWATMDERSLVTQLFLNQSNKNKD